jgi:DNA-binding beta-propeller fold protein YncE
MKKQNQAITRRHFLKETAGSAGILAVGSGAFAASIGLGQAATAGKDANPFVYDVDRLRKTDPKLIHYEQVGSFRSPHEDSRRIAIGPDDQVYIAAGNYVSVLDRDGTRITEIAFPSEARCVAAAGDGTIYAAVRDHVEVLDRKGQRLATWASPGNRTWFTGLAVAENDVFAADAGNRVILRYDKSGKLVGRLAEKNKERNIPGLILPSPYLDVVLARDGLLRVNNTGRHRVEAYTFSGDLEFSWGKPSNAIEGFCGCCNPIGLAMLPDGRYVTCEKGLPRVKVYSPEGVFESVVAGTESFAENAKSGINKTRADCMLGGLNAAVDSQQRIYILDLVVNDVRVMKRKA